MNPLRFFHIKAERLKIKETGSLAISTALGQVITYLLLPFVGRLYSTQEFSEFSIFYAWLIPLSILSSLRIELAIPNQTRLEDQYRVTGIAISMSLYFSVLIQLLLLFFYWLFPFLHTLYLFIPLGIICTSLPQTLYFLSTRKNQYQQSAWYRIVNNLGVQAITIGLGYCSWGIWGLLAGLLGGQILGAFILSQGNLKAILPFLQYPFTKKNGLAFKDYIFFSMPQALLESLQLSGTIALLSVLFHDPYPGIYYLCWRILQAPITAISNTLFVVQYNECAQLYHQNKSYLQNIKTNALYMTIVGLIIGVIFFLWGPSLFALILGPQHFLSGKMAQYLAIWFTFQFIVSPFSFAALIKNKQRTSLLINAIDIILKLIAFMIGFSLDNVWWALGIYSVLSAGLNLYTFRWYLTISRSSNESEG
jgi:O-antigen/teichoic acid export membrane protein